MAKGRLPSEAHVDATLERMGNSGKAPVRVLIADDEENQRTGLSSMIRAWGFETAMAADGQEALDLLSSFPADVLLTDLMMPRIDGQALYEDVVRNYPFLAEKFLFITGQAVRQAGMSDFIYGTGNRLLEKPFEMDELRDALREMFAK